MKKYIASLLLSTSLINADIPDILKDQTVFQKVSELCVSDTYNGKNLKEVFEHFSEITSHFSNGALKIDNAFFQSNEFYDLTLLWRDIFEHTIDRKLILAFVDRFLKKLEKVTQLGEEKALFVSWIKQALSESYFPVIKAQGERDTTFTSSYEHENPKYKYTIAALFRDDARFLKEWIEYNRMMGIDHIYLFNHLSKDDFISVLTPYINDGFISLVNIELNPTSSEQWFRDIQYKTYISMARLLSGQAEWMLLIDTDEFLAPWQSKSIPEFLEKYHEKDGVAFFWKLFGTGNVGEIKQDQLMIETLIKCEKDYNRVPKYAVRPDKMLWIHEGYIPLMQTQEKLTFAPHEEAQLMHYANRDLEFFHSIKINRIFKKDEGTEEYLLGLDKKWSESEDTRMLRFVPELRKRMKK
jgi:hypothetical protein